MVAAMTPLPVIGVPVTPKGAHLDGLDALMSIVQVRLWSCECLSHSWNAVLPQCQPSKYVARINLDETCLHAMYLLHQLLSH